MNITETSTIGTADYDKPAQVAYSLVQQSGKGIVAENRKPSSSSLLDWDLGKFAFCLIELQNFGSCRHQEQPYLPPGINQQRMDCLDHCIWSGFTSCFTFIWSSIMNWCLVQPIKDLFGGESSQWFLYGLCIVLRCQLWKFE